MRLEALKIDDIGSCHQAGKHGDDPYLERLLATLACWRLRTRQRERLAALDHAARKDIGITEADVWRELRKPLWRR